MKGAKCGATKNREVWGAMELRKETGTSPSWLQEFIFILRIIGLLESLYSWVLICLLMMSTMPDVTPSLPLYLKWCPSSIRLHISFSNHCLLSASKTSSTQCLWPWLAFSQQFSCWVLLYPPNFEWFLWHAKNSGLAPFCLPEWLTHLQVEPSLSCYHTDLHCEPCFPLSFSKLLPVALASIYLFSFV